MGLEAVLGAALDETMVVVGAVELDLPDGVTRLPNPAWADGQAGSLSVALAHASAKGHDAVVVGLGDQPLVSTRAWRLVNAATGAPIAVATYGGRRRFRYGSPQPSGTCCPGLAMWEPRDLIADRPELAQDVPCPGTPVDIDTVENLHRWS